MQRVKSFWGMCLCGILLIPGPVMSQILDNVVVKPAPPTIERSEAEVIESKIRASFEAYRNFILTDQGEEATRYIAERTIQFYDSMAVLARTADSLQVDSLSLIDKLTVLTLRARTPNDLLFSYEGKEVFIFAIDEGMVGKDDVRNNELGKIFLGENFARAAMVVSGQETPLEMYFRLEDGIWKLDLTSLFPMSNRALGQVIEEGQMTENQFMEFAITYSLRGEAPQHPIWKVPSRQ